ncbi:hypothetical protein NOF04DRAFT_1017008 [Fusarium oxysporum II5]|uniref:Uncharacterized protein n=3 Tax=Fusarium oxysporum species complex TaxID=171631 RepID=N1RQ88_FUSC4|nr:hypothetical protein FOC4_g10005844 [Fusarium odoratissimum]KAK2123470.1 hypothetical protein NOF04DRAFT_1017008 [Fusarium oxysporum II5]TXB95946.1 hypothetical protein FocTR4_00015910 [Fusarium oxysporum f. sp. cubense]
MRFNPILSLAFGLPAVIAGPCKPGSSSQSSDAVLTASTQATASGVASSETASTTVPGTIETSTADVPSTSTAIESDTMTLITSLDTTETTTVAPTTTTSEEPAVTTFNIVAEGGAVDGIVMGQKEDYYNLQFSTNPAWEPVALILEEGTGYLRRADPYRPNFPLVCIRWGSGTVPNPGWFIDCSASDTYYGAPIKCDLKTSGELSCSISAGHCRHYTIPPRDNDAWDCQADDGVFRNFYTEESTDEDDVTYYDPWMGFGGYEGKGFYNPLEPVTFRWRSAD